MDPEIQRPGFLRKYKFTLISLVIICLAAIPLLLLSNTASKKVVSSLSPTVTISPTTTPLTTTNVAPTLTQVDTNMQQTLNQVDTDLKATNTIDTSQDSTTGL